MISYEFSIRTVQAQPVMYVRGPVKFPELAAKIGEFLTEVGACLTAHSVGTIGMPYTRYHVVNGEDIDLEAGIPVAAHLPEQGRVRAGTLPGSEAAVTSHYGPYEGLVAAGTALAKWTTAQGREASGPNWEVYVTDPGMEPDPAKWRTDLYKPLK